MIHNELPPFRAGIHHAANVGITAPFALEIRFDARHIWQQAAVAALRGSAEA